MPKRILVVDDEATIVHLLEVVLQGEGYQIEKAYNGVEALKKIQRDIPDLIILDVNMPELSGWDVLAAVRAGSASRNLPVLMCTNRDLVSDVEQAETLGATGYITKPFEIDRMIRKVKQILEK
ncbi:MAG: response regulator [Elusimicrobia bacterium]|nr:response regulator [Elusimicrobiota bacterium]